jgi:hypothetical protein
VARTFPGRYSSTQRCGAWYELWRKKKPAQAVLERRFRELLETAPDAIIEADAEGHRAR